MKFRRLMALFFCSIMVFYAVPFFVAAVNNPDFEELYVQSSGGMPVKVEVSRSMFQEYQLISDRFLYTERQWIEFLVQNLLVGNRANEINKVILCRTVPRKGGGTWWVTCPTVLPGRYKFLAGWSGSVLTVVCPYISSTLCGKWYLNETGFSLFGR